jgi:hypothetical protein
VLIARAPAAVPVITLAPLGLVVALGAGMHRDHAPGRRAET